MGSAFSGSFGGAVSDIKEKEEADIMGIMNDVKNQ